MRFMKTEMVGECSLKRTVAFRAFFRELFPNDFEVKRAGDNEI
jgi:hypothetical protein